MLFRLISVFAVIYKISFWSSKSFKKANTSAKENCQIIWSNLASYRYYNKSFLHFIGKCSVCSLVLLNNTLPLNSEQNTRESLSPQIPQPNDPKSIISNIKKKPQSTSGTIAVSHKIQKNWLLGQIRYSLDSRFVRIPQPYAAHPNLYLHSDTFTAFQKMYAAARKDNIPLTIVSAARSYSRQKSIWEAKLRQILKTARKASKQLSRNDLKKILEYSAMPKTSRHHWGSEIDLNSVENKYFEQGIGIRVHKWLKQNAIRFGFCQVYSTKGKNRLHGYKKEPWHWSYLPLARPLSKAYLKKISYADITGFSGAEFAPSLYIIEHYVNGIDKSCR